jgi:hypothetical protein
MINRRELITGVVGVSVGVVIGAAANAQMLRWFSLPLSKDLYLGTSSLQRDYSGSEIYIEGKFRDEIHSQDR